MGLVAPACPAMATSLEPTQGHLSAGNVWVRVCSHISGKSLAGGRDLGEDSKYKGSGFLRSSPRTALWPLISHFIPLSPAYYKEGHRSTLATSTACSEDKMGQASNVL